MRGNTKYINCTRGTSFSSFFFFDVVCSDSNFGNLEVCRCILEGLHRTVDLTSSSLLCQQVKLLFSDSCRSDSPRGTLLLLLLKCCFTSTETVGLLGMGALDVHLDFHTAPELCCKPVVVEILLYVHRNRRLIRDGSPGRPPRLSHSS